MIRRPFKWLTCSALSAQFLSVIRSRFTTGDVSVCLLPITPLRYALSSHFQTEMSADVLHSRRWIVTSLAALHTKFLEKQTGTVPLHKLPILVHPNLRVKPAKHSSRTSTERTNDVLNGVLTFAWPYEKTDTKSDSKQQTIKSSFAAEVNGTPKLRSTWPVRADIRCEIQYSALGCHGILSNTRNLR